MEATVRQLKTQLKNISTESLLGMISLNFISTSNYDGGVTNMLTTIMDIPLKAPQRQLIYGFNWVTVNDSSLWKADYVLFYAFSIKILIIPFLLVDYSTSPDQCVINGISQV